MATSSFPKKTAKKAAPKKAAAKKAAAKKSTPAPAETIEAEVVPEEPEEPEASEQTAITPAAPAQPATLATFAKEHPQLFKGSGWVESDAQKGGQPWLSIVQASKAAKIAADPDGVGELGHFLWGNRLSLGDSIDYALVTEVELNYTEVIQDEAERKKRFPNRYDERSVQSAWDSGVQTEKSATVKLLIHRDGDSDDPAATSDGQGGHFLPALLGITPANFKWAIPDIRAIAGEHGYLGCYIVLSSEFVDIPRNPYFKPVFSANEDTPLDPSIKNVVLGVLNNS